MNACSPDINADIPAIGAAILEIIQKDPVPASGIETLSLWIEVEVVEVSGILACWNTCCAARSGRQDQIVFPSPNMEIKGVLWMINVEPQFIISVGSGSYIASKSCFSHERAKERRR